MDKVQDFRKYMEQGAYHWTSLKPSYTTAFNPYLLARYNITLKNIPALAGAQEKLAVDLGCGDAYFANQLALRGYRVRGIDGAEAAIHLGKNLLTPEVQGKVQLSVGNICRSEIPDASADLVVSLDVIEHLEQPKELLQEISRIAKDNATILIGTPIRITEQPLDKYHVHEFFSEEFATLLKPYFTISHIIKSHPVEYLALMLRKFRILGKEKNWAWNAINLFYLLTKHNLLENQNSKFPTYQLAVCQRAPR